MVGLSSYGFAVEPMLAARRDALSHLAGQLAARPEAVDRRASPTCTPAARPCRPSASARSSSRPTRSSADIIVLLGDFAASHKFKTRSVAPEEWAEALGELKAPLGVHAMLGNHDWWDDLAAQRTRQGPVLGRRVLERVGIPVYENDATRLVKDGRRFWLAGLGDQLAFITRPPQARPAQVRGRRRSRRHAGQGHRRCARDPAGARARHLPARARARVADAVRATPTAARCACSAIRRWCPRASATATPTAISSRTTAISIVSGGLGCSILPVRIGVPPGDRAWSMSPPDQHQPAAGPTSPAA